MLSSCRFIVYFLTSHLQIGHSNVSFFLVFRSLGSGLKSNVRTPSFDLINCFKEMATYGKYRYE